MKAIIHTGQSLDVLKTLPAGSARCCVTSPPYWGLRDYGHDQQIGLEDTPEAYVARLVAVFAEVKRVLSDDGTLWLNIGDSYAGSSQTGGTDVSGLLGYGNSGTRNPTDTHAPKRKTPATLKPKDMVGIPWMLAFALRSDGWYLRSDIIWHKPNPMPESVRDRPTKAHEYVFLLSKNRRYYWDQDAVREPDCGRGSGNDFKNRQGSADHQAQSGGIGGSAWKPGKGRNTRSVWTIPTHPFPGAHFAVMPPALADRCIRAGSAIGDVVLDPFNGAGTTGMVARRLQRQYIGIELNPEYAEQARRRIDSDAPLFNR